ncbi:MAG: alpha/beta hydrolase [Spirochaetales bacterium]|nr:alpha/beta hydrolase [Spirochaetales bacterium]
MLSELKDDLPILKLRETITDPRVLTYLEYYNLDIDVVDHFFGYLNINKTDIAVHVFIPPSPIGTVITAHGYVDHVGGWKNAIRSFSDASYAVIAFDFPGHGLSGGEDADIKNFSEYQAVFATMVEFTEYWLPSPLHFVGHSMGAGIMAEYLLIHGKDAERRVVLIAPNIRSSFWWASQVGAAIIQPFTVSIATPFRLTSHDRIFIEFRDYLDPLQRQYIPTRWFEELVDWTHRMVAYKSSNVSLRVIQGDSDSVTAWRYNARFLKAKFPNTDFIRIYQGRHHLINESIDVRERIFGLVEDYLGS